MLQKRLIKQTASFGAFFKSLPSLSFTVSPAENREGLAHSTALGKYYG